MEIQKLNALQFELLKVYSLQPDEEDLLAIRKIISYLIFLTNCLQRFSSLLLKKLLKRILIVGLMNKLRLIPDTMFLVSPK